MARLGLKKKQKITRIKQKKRHLAYFNFIDALKKKGCPICFLVQDHLHRFMKSLLYENVNNPCVREEIRNSAGFCNLHSWQLKKSGDGLGVSIIYEDLCNKIKKDIEKLKSEKFIENLDFRIKEICPACVEKQKIENMYVKSFLEYFFEEKFNREFRNSFGLCIPHLLMVLKQNKDKILKKELLVMEIEKIKNLENELKEYQRKSDYRFGNKDFGKERDSWVRAIEKLAAKEGIF